MVLCCTKKTRTPGAKVATIFVNLALVGLSCTAEDAGNRPGEKNVTVAIFELWDIQDPKAPKKVISQKGFGKEAEAVAFTADGNAVGTIGGYRVLVWDTKTKKVLLEDEQTGLLGCLAFSPKEKVLAVGYSPGNVATFNLENEKRNAFHVEVADVPTFSVRCLAFSPDGKILVVGGGQRTDKPGKVLFLDSTTGKELGRLDAVKMVESVMVSPDGKWLVVRPDGQHDKFHDWNTKKEVSPLKGLKKISLSRFSTDGKRMEAGSEEGVGIWDIDSGKKLVRLEFPKQITRAFACSNDLKIAALAGSEQNNFVQFWDLENNRLAWSLMGSEIGYFASAAFSPDGKMLALCGITFEAAKKGEPVPSPSSVVPLPYLEWFIGGAAFLAVLVAGFFIYRRKGPSQNRNVGEEKVSGRVRTLSGGRFCRLGSSR